MLQKIQSYDEHFPQWCFSKRWHLQLSCAFCFGLFSTDSVIDTQEQDSDPAFVRLRNPSTGLLFYLYCYTLYIIRYTFVYKPSKGSENPSISNPKPKDIQVYYHRRLWKSTNILIWETEIINEWRVVWVFLTSSCAMELFFFEWACAHVFLRKEMHSTHLLDLKDTHSVF